MDKFLLFFGSLLSLQIALAQPSEMINEIFSLKSLETNDLYLTPNDENPDIYISESNGIHTIKANGIQNVLTADATFNEYRITINNDIVTPEDCTETNCYYENIYFYELLTSQSSNSKTFFYNYYETNGYKYLSIRDTHYNIARYSTERTTEPDPLLFQTWYLYMVEVDLGEPTFYNGTNSPQITINQDLSYTGIDFCSLISGDFIVGSGDEYYDFTLQSQNYVRDQSNCDPGQTTHVMHELGYSYPLGVIIYEYGGTSFLSYETSPGFISYFINQPLSTSKNNLSSFNIFPNPVKDKLMIIAENNDIVSISILDINGRVIKSLKKLDLKEIDVSALIAGMYFITITSSEGNSTKKFIKN